MTKDSQWQVRASNKKPTFVFNRVFHAVKPRAGIANTPIYVSGATKLFHFMIILIILAVPLFLLFYFTVNTVC